MNPFALLCILIGGITLIAVYTKNNKDVPILVIGGGMSGLSAARQLKAYGFPNVKIMEATNVFGGRVKSGKFGTDKIRIEYGAQWLHAIDHNPLLDELIAQNLLDKKVKEEIDKYKEPFEEYFDYFDFFDSEGKVGDDFKENDFRKSVQELDLLYVKIFDDPTKVGVNESILEIDSYGLAMRVVFDPWLKSKAKDDEKLTKFLLRANAVVNGYQMFDAASKDLDSVSIAVSNEYDEEGGDVQPPLVDGFSSLINAWVKEFDERYLYLNHRVLQVDYSGKYSVRVSYEVNGKVNKTELFQHVIITTPLKFLQQNYQTFFVPQLSNEREENLTQHLSQGIVEKVFIELNEPVNFPQAKSLLGNPLAFSVVMPDHDANSTAFIKGEKTFYNLHSSRKYFVTAFVGEDGEKVSRMNNTDLAEMLRQVLSKALGKPSLAIVNIDKSTWNENPFALGAYSRAKPQAPEDIFTSQSISIFNKQGTIPFLLFAGEHTHPYWFSTMHGAYDSGKKAAKVINGYY